MKKRLFLLLAFCWVSFVCTPAIDLKESKFTQVVNDVQIISTVNNAKHPAVVDALFKIPDVIRTGAASRAELVAEDRTITRVGANTIFSFDQANRSIHLEQGSLLFNSPKGKGGGNVHTAAATAAVLGTTIIVSTTPNGGFKVLTLEGRAEVRFVNGVHRQLDSGQMTFVLPGGIPGPVIMFRLDQQIAGSTLVKGFIKPLPAQPRIDAAVTKQVREIKSGRAQDTGLHVGDQATPTGVQVIKLFDEVSASNGDGFIPGLNDNSSTPGRPGLPPGFAVPPRLVFNQDAGGFVPASGSGYLFTSSSAVGTNPAVPIEFSAGPADAALDDQTISGPLTASDARVFRQSVDISSIDPAIIRYPSFMGVVGQNITINTPSLDLNQFAPMDHFDFLSLQDLHIASSLDITASQIPNGVNFIADSGRKILIDSGVHLNVDTPSLFLTSPAGLTLDSVTISKQNNAGNLSIVSDSAISMDKTYISGGTVSVASGGTFSATATGDTSDAGGLTGNSGVSVNSTGGATIGIDLNADQAVGTIDVVNNSGLLTVNNGANINASVIRMTSPGGLKLDSVVIAGNEMNVSGGFFSGSSVDVQNSTFNLNGGVNIQTGSDPLTISGTHITAGSISASGSGAAILNNNTLTAGNQLDLTAGSDLTLSDTPVSGSAVRIDSGGTLSATRTVPTQGEIRGDSSVTLNSGNGATIGVNVTSGTTPTSGSISLFNGSSQLAVSSGVTLAASSISANSPGGISIDSATVSGSQVSLSARPSFAGGPITVQNSGVTATSSLNVDSRAGAVFDTATVTAGDVNLTGGQAAIAGVPATAAGAVSVANSTFDLTGSMTIQNDTGVLIVNNSSRITAAGNVTANSPNGISIDTSPLTGNQINLVSRNPNNAGSISLQNSTLTAAAGLGVDSDAVSLNNATLTAAGDLNVQTGSLGLNNTVLAGDTVTVASAGVVSAPNVAPNNGRITGNSAVNLTSQSGGMTIGVDVSANAASGTINIVNNGGILTANGGKTFQAGFVNVSSPGGFLFDGTTVAAGTRANFTAGSQPGTLAVVQNTAFTGAADVNIAGHTVVLNQVNFAAGSAVTLSSALGQLAANPNTGQQVQGGFVNYIQNVTYNNSPAQDFTGAGKPITIRSLP